MRALFLLLLLANLLFLAWAAWIAPTSPLAGAPTPAAPGNHAIQLLREAPLARELPAGGSLMTLTPADQPGAGCISAGPFLEKVQAEAAATRLQNLGFKSRMRAANEPVAVGKWVRVPNLATPEDAANALAGLKAAGLVDAEIFKDDSPGNSVSIGVFSDPARAQQAAETARRAGYTVVVSERTRPADVWWLDIDRLENGSFPNLDSLRGARPTEPSLEFRACPATAQPPG